MEIARVGFMNNQKDLKLAILSLLIAAVSLSCNRYPETRIEKYENGKIRSEIPYKNDSTIDGIAKYYHSNGQLSSWQPYTDGQEDGMVKDYYENGDIKSEAEWKAGVQDGISRWYYINGTLKDQSIWRNGKQYGSGFIYFENGNLKWYQCLAFDGRSFYVLEADAEGQILREEGALFSPDFLIEGIKEEDTIPLNASIQIELIVAEPPEMKTKVLMGELNDETGAYNLEELNVVSSLAKFNHVFRNIGTRKVLTVCVANTKEGKEYGRDSIVTTFIVK